ncbi:MAG: hypothetical protein A2908_04280 [Candidatus Staskawiczbacteria bacterium RIFCSPLOWO2_01_FULL_38_12b]|uniref:PKD domain-containing protein n=1 Tax=Candidatus Staskawiczbacteria bacterium RIFCSPLOWO2_01_FULL_38_12b TaxID=1802214 RepID=A0A1G2IGA6_9BACT|nr:MAG: hypothetical protein A2908_04280 [Candidatus Staskawiczbacteria bacterium RIFCSPLOWO2_01_FULL_38_12b]
MTTEGTTYFRYESTDNAGNVQTTVSRSVKIDGTAPIVNAGEDKSGTQFTQTATVTDAASGILSYLWTKTSGPGTITFGTAVLSETTISASANGTYVINLAVTDNAGNSASDSFTLDWRVQTGGGGGGGGISHNECQNQQCVAVAGSGTSQCQGNSQCIVAPPVPTPTPSPIIEQIIQPVSQQIQTITNNIINPLPPLFTPSQVAPSVPVPTPEAFKPQELIAPNPLGVFDLSSIPSDISFFAQKFPAFNSFLRDVGINKIADLQKLGSVQLTLPGFTQTSLAQKPGAPVPPPSDAIPVPTLTKTAAANVPTDVIFAKTAGGLIDINTNLSFDSKGNAFQKINIPVNKPVELIVKPDQPVKSITGLVLFSKPLSVRPVIYPAVTASTQSTPSILLASLIGQATAAQNTDTAAEIPAATDNHNPVQLLLQKFSYAPIANGFWSAEFTSPSIEGEYDIITIMDYQDSNLVPKQIKLITVVDPEGYVYTKLPEGKLRIEGATVSLLWQNPKTLQYELWPAEKYLQKNPQITNDTGKYAFLTPEGTYYLQAIAQGYQSYSTESFTIEKGSLGVFIDLPLKKITPWYQWPLRIAIMLVSILLILFLVYRKFKSRWKNHRGSTM